MCTARSHEDVSHNATTEWSICFFIILRRNKWLKIRFFSPPPPHCQINLLIYYMREISPSYSRKILWLHCKFSVAPIGKILELTALLAVLYSLRDIFSVSRSKSRRCYWNHLLLSNSCFTRPHKFPFYSQLFWYPSALLATY